MSNTALPTCKQTGDKSQANNRIDRRSAVLVEKARVARVTKMRLGAKYTDAVLAEMMLTSKECTHRWRSADETHAPTVTSLLAANAEVFDVLLNEILAARVRLGHAPSQPLPEADDRSKQVAQKLAELNALLK